MKKYMLGYLSLFTTIMWLISFIINAVNGSHFVALCNFICVIIYAILTKMHLATYFQEKKELKLQKLAAKRKEAEAEKKKAEELEKQFNFF